MALSRLDRKSRRGYTLKTRLLDIRMRASVRFLMVLTLAALSTIGWVTPVLAQEDSPQNFTPADFVRLGTLVDQQPLAPEAFSLRNDLRMWADHQGLEPAGVCATLSPWRPVAGDKDLLGILMFTQYVLVTQVDQQIRPQVSAKEHQRAGLKSALRFYAALQNQATTDRVAATILKNAPQKTNPLALHLIQEFNTKGDAGLDPYVCAGPRYVKPPLTDHSTCETWQPTSATTESDGVEEEHEWTQAYYPSSVWESQALVQCPKGAADKITLRTAKGPVIVFFDINGFFGR